jgi:hypothetical protein
MNKNILNCLFMGTAFVIATLSVAGCFTDSGFGLGWILGLLTAPPAIPG